MPAQTTFTIAILTVFMMSCGFIPQNSDEKSDQYGQADVYGDEGEKQGFYLSLPEISGADLEMIHGKIYRGELAFASENPACQTSPDPQDTVLIDVQETLALQDDTELTVNQPVPLPEPNLVLEFERVHGSGPVKVMLAEGTYTILLEGYNGQKELTYNGVSYVRIYANQYSKTLIRLKRVSSNCQGGLVIDYTVEDEPQPQGKVDVCRLVEKLPVPNECSNDPREIASCHMRSLDDVPGVHGPKSCSVEYAKYALLKTVCNSIGAVYQKQLDDIMCESSPLNSPTQ